MIGRPPRSVMVWSSVLALIFLLGITHATRAETFVENFSTLEYCDLEATTANWDTIEEQLHLHPYPLHAEAGINVNKAATCFARSGDHVFLGIQDAGIHVVDISDIHKMRYVGEFYWIEFPNAMWTEGDFLYVAAHDRFIILDITDPTALQIIGESSEMTQVNDVVVSGGLAFLSSCSAGMYAVDISDPTAPSVIGRLDTPTCAQSLTLHGDHAYVCTGYTGFSVIDISDPSAPSHVFQVPASYHPERICVSGNLAYVSEISEELLIYSLVDPARPTLIGACDLPGHGIDVAVSGTLAYLTIGDPNVTEFCAVDVSDPTDPRVVNSSELVGTPSDVELFGEFALVNSFTHFIAVRIADPVPPVPAGEMQEPLIFDFQVDGSLAYMSAWDVGERSFCTVSLADPEAPVLLGSCPLGTYPMGLALASPYAYMGSFSRGLQVLDIRDPANPHIVCLMDLDRNGVSVLPHGDHLFLGYIDNGVGLMTLDISDPTNPVPLSDLPLEYSPREMCLSGHHLFVLQWEDGARDDRHSDIAVLDISDPTAIVPVATFAVPEAYVEFMRIDGNLLYASFWSYLNWYGNGFVIYDISDPLDPQPLSRWEDGGGLGQMVLSGDLAYQTGGSQIDVIDVSVPTSPVHLHRLETERETIWLGAGGDHLFASGGYGGLRSVRIFDRSVDVHRNVAQSLNLPAVGTPIRQVRLESVQSQTISWEFSADAGLHWQALPHEGHWLAVEHPGFEPCWRVSLHYTEIGEPPFVDELSLEWTSDPTSIIDYAVPGAFCLQSPRPNPSNPRTAIRFSLPHPCHARVEIFDLAGRRVRSFVDAKLPAGQHQVDWDGRNGEGASLGSGIYVLRMQAGSFRQSRKLVLVR